VSEHPARKVAGTIVALGVAALVGLAAGGDVGKYIVAGVTLLAALYWLLTSDALPKHFPRWLRRIPLVYDREATRVDAGAASKIELGRRAIRIARQAERDAQLGVDYFREHRGGEWHELLDDLQAADALGLRQRRLLDVEVNVTNLTVGNGTAEVEAIGRRLLRESGVEPDTDQPSETLRDPPADDRLPWRNDRRDLANDFDSVAGLLANYLADRARDRPGIEAQNVEAMVKAKEEAGSRPT
jgi:hypothetical protein